MTTSLTQLKAQRRAFYKSIVSVYCPILQDTVYFTSQGFNHLINQSNPTPGGGTRPRMVSEQFLKLQLLAYAPDVVKKCAKVGEIRTGFKMVKGQKKAVTWYELIHDFGKGIKWV